MSGFLGGRIVKRRITGLHGRVPVRLLWGAALMVALAALMLPLRARAEEYHVEITDQGFNPSHIAGRLDSPVRIDIHNSGHKPHNFILPAFYIYTANLKANESTWVEFTPDKTGVYRFFSDAGGRPEPGLAGQIRVQS